MRVNKVGDPRAAIKGIIALRPQVEGITDVPSDVTLLSLKDTETIPAMEAKPPVLLQMQKAVQP